MKFAELSQKITFFIEKKNRKECENLIGVKIQKGIS